ncbi:aldo/keto reductase [uncultured Pseudokineococcus sp.]|uniref:aldo/keto reductase n=1 Tax=uncultured Pseudokineococcus sp. TaxID=1642928 RepID=UPI00263551F1|nr:aldo/keto reductase [uncultured Pseudokineococcus sp.]
METRRVGRSGLRVSRLGLGTLTWGRDTDEHEASEQLRDFADAGGTLVSTAASGSGEAEELLGALLDDVVPRRDLVLALRVGSRGLGAARRTDGSRRSLLADLDDSLARLRTDHVDLLLLGGTDRGPTARSAAERGDDGPGDGGAPVEESLAALAEAQRSGRARYTGLAEHGAWQTARAAALAQAGGAPLAAVEVEHSLVARWADVDLRDAAAASGVGLLARSPLGGGVLTGKYRHALPADSRAASPHLVHVVEPHLDPSARGVVEAVRTAADGLERSPLEVALAWAADRPGVASAVTGARTAAQLRAALAGEDLRLPAPIRAALDEVSSARTAVGRP